MLTSSILSNLVFNEAYYRIVYPHLKREYFRQGSERIVYGLISKYIDKYEVLPTKNALLVELETKNSLNQSDFETSIDLINSMNSVPEDLNWLVDSTEKFCQDNSLYNALTIVNEIQHNSSLNHEERNPKIPDVGVIPELLRDALGICFDTSVGHDYFEDYESRWESYVKRTAKIPFTIEILNRITQGGVERKTLNLIMAGVNVGKSLSMCTLSADYLTQGLNVLYISMEMSEEAVSKRIDANLMNVSMDDFDTLTGGSYKDKIKALASRNKIGKLIVKQFPTGGASVNHFNALMEELKTKKGWKPDVVMVDYLGICASSRIQGYSENSYQYVKAVAEELRGFAIRWDVAVWSGAQTNRNGWDSSDIEMGDIAESAGLAATADFILAVMETTELAELGQYLAKQIKSRYGDKSKWSKFPLGVDKGKQRLYELDETAISAPMGVDEVSNAMQKQANQNAMATMVTTKPISDLGSTSKRSKLDHFDIEGFEF